MRTRHHGFAASNAAENDGGLAISAVDIGLVFVSRQHLDLVGLGRGRIDKDSASVIVGKSLGWNVVLTKRLPGDLQPHHARALLAGVLEALEGASATGPREEAQLPVADDLQARVADLELAPPAAVVAAGAEAQERAPAAHKVADAAVALAVEGLAVAEIGAAGEHEQRARRRPRLLDQHRLGDGDDGVVGREQAAQSPDAVAD